MSSIRDPKWQTLAGVDGCRAGWLVVTLDGGRNVNVSGAIYSDAAELFASLGPSALVAIDIPIGLPTRGPRACDLEARQLLGRPRMSSVFPAPIRRCLKAKTYQEASELRFKMEGKRLSRQAFGILDKVCQVDKLLRADDALARRVVEVHPEVSFAVWNGEKSMVHNKKKAAGKIERLTLIDKEWPNSVERLRAKLRGFDFAADDLHDAFAALWSAKRFVRGYSRLLGPANDQDDHHLPMRIIA